MVSYHIRWYKFFWSFDRLLHPSSNSSFGPFILLGFLIGWNDFKVYCCLNWQLAQSGRNLVEEQRALATIGRTWFVYSGDAISAAEQDEYLLQSQTAYLDSLAVCDKLLGTVSEKDLLEMKSRLYLNLGLTYERDSEEDCARAKSFMEKALVIARYCFWLAYQHLNCSLFEEPVLSAFSKIQLVVYDQCRILIGWATVY